MCNMVGVSWRGHSFIVLVEDISLLSVSLSLSLSLSHTHTHTHTHKRTYIYIYIYIYYIYIYIISHGKLSMAVFILIYNSHPYRLRAVVPRWKYSYTQGRVTHDGEPSEGFSAGLYVHLAASHGFIKKIDQLPEPTASTLDHNIDIICIQEHRYTHSKDIK